MPGNRLRPVAGKDRNPARGRFRQGAAGAGHRGLVMPGPVPVSLVTC